MARPSLITEEHVDRARAEVASGVSFEAVASRLGIGRSTLFEWIKRGEESDDPEDIYARFAAEVRAGESDFEASMVESVTGESGKKGEWPRFSWMLERRFPTRYGARQKIEHTGADGGAIKVDAGKLLASLSRLAGDGSSDPDSGESES